MTYKLTQGDSTYEIEPLSNNNNTAEEFYSYDYPDNASANTPLDLEREDTSQLFLYDGPNGLSLFIIHDEPNTNSGGNVTLSFTGLPETGSWVVTDDSGDSYSHQQASWRWYPCCTDGGVFRGGLKDGFEITIDPSFDSGINTWILRAADQQPIQLDLNETITITDESRVSASVTTLQFIPGRNENISEGGSPLEGSLLEFFDEDTTIEAGDWFEQELPVDPVLDSWLKGDQTYVEDDVRPGNDELPVDLEEARNKVQRKYSDEFGSEAFGIFRFENEIEVSFETKSGDIDDESVEIKFNESGIEPGDERISLKQRENPITVTPKADVSGIPAQKWHGGFSDRSNRKPRHYKYDTDFEFDGVKGVRVLTISGGYAGFVANWAKRVSENAAAFFNTVWDWGVDQTVAELAMLAAPIQIQPLIAQLTVVPNTYTFTEFIVLADGRRYARVWDASQYPSLATYIDGERKSLEKMPYDPRQKYKNPHVIAFLAQASAGLTPYHAPLGFYGWLLENTESRQERLSEGIEEILKTLPEDWEVSETLFQVPRETLGYDADGNPIDKPSEVFDISSVQELPWENQIQPNE
ncbi:hypothetical protein [Haloparvum sp. PAK95]|uniref:hypothetical protein n=1 Tax=Haloparvum sp. PAK95 TaxID=3418962 RepID=UPI003D2EB336